MNEKFSYTYSAHTHSEVDKIRSKYVSEPVPDDKLEQLKRLDRSCERPGTIAAIITGVIGTVMLVASLVMILSMSVFLPGMILGIAGLGIMAAALPVYREITKLNRMKIAPEIIRLSDEIKNDTSV